MEHAMLSRNKIHLFALGFLTLFFLSTYLLPSGVRPMIRPDEFRYAEIPREMLESGNWVTPHLNGIRYFEKPALGYQLTALSFSVFGENTFALRLPSVLAVLLTAAFLYYLVSRKSRDPFLPGLATGTYLTFGLVFGVGTFAVMDSQLTAAITLSIGSFYLACESRQRTFVLLWLVSAGFWAGCAFLIKGFVALAIPSIVFIPCLLWRRNWKQLLLYPWLPLFVAVSVALPWSWMIHRAEPDFWHYFFVEEHWHRFTGHTYDRAPQPFWYFIPVLLGGIMPVGLLAIPGVFNIKRNRLKNPLTVFLLCWAVVPFLFFSVSSCKLGTYILPCFPPLAILLAMTVRNAMHEHSIPYRKTTAVITRILGWILVPGAVLTAAGLSIWNFLQALPRLYDGFPGWMYASLLFTALFGILLLQKRDVHPLKDMVLFLIAMIPLVVCGLHSFPTAVMGDKLTEIGLSHCRNRMNPAADDLIVVDRSVMASAAWILKRNDLIVLGKPGELEYGFKNYPEYSARHYQIEEFPALLKKQCHGHVFLVTLQNLRHKPFPSDWPIPEIVSDHGVTMAKF